MLLATLPRSSFQEISNTLRRQSCSREALNIIIFDIQRMLPRSVDSYGAWRDDYHLEDRYPFSAGILPVHAAH